MRSIVIGVFIAASPLVAFAGNGLNLIGFGVESLGMGGADVAVARDTTALNTNPAGLGQLGRPALDSYGSAAYALDVGHADSLGNDLKVSNRFITVGGLGYSRPFMAGRLVAGFGLFVQGGSGAVYSSIRTPFGTQDQLSALVGLARLSAGLAWRAADDVTIGLALPLNVISAKQRVFPNTSVANASDPSQNFFGLRIDDARGVRLGMRLGVLWNATPQLAVGVVYSPESTLAAKDGRAELNLSAIGLGVVPYRQARLDGFALAREVSVGLAWKASPATLISLKISHLDWSHAIRDMTLTLSEPENPRAPAVVSQTSAVGWRDQTVLALGVAYRVTPAVTAYAGVNRARNPAPAATLTPLLAGIAENHLTAGLSWDHADGWRVGTAIEYLRTKRVRYLNPSFPLGESEERTRYVALHAMVSRRW